MNLSNMFPASGGLAAQIKKPVATAVAKPTDNKAVGSSLADCMQTRKRPGEWAIKWPKLRKQGFKDYRPLLTIQEVIDYCNRCEETGLGGFDYETSGDKDHRIPPTDEDGNTVTGKALDSWTRDVNLDPWKAEVCAIPLDTPIAGCTGIVVEVTLGTPKDDHHFTDLCDDCRLKFLKMAVEHLERKVAAEKEGLNNDGEETDV